eukprot:TRINITY_DN39888_c0_g1_i1.p1 TRINITY_DN39888_c0_g1~~TRINITY_DN39888_c0_g1_i1.p1  ORF type:complete len:145 (-),score=23.99 TRINITY_DN39888_c0_g1_i1:107-541(-)
MIIFSICCQVFFFLMIRRPPRSTQGVSSAASDVYKRQELLTVSLQRSIKQMSKSEEPIQTVPAQHQEEASSSVKTMDVQGFVERMGVPADIILNNATDAVLQIKEDGSILRANPIATVNLNYPCLLYTSPSPRDLSTSRMPSSA